MKLTREEFKRTGHASALALFHQGIRTEATRAKYERTLRYVVCKILEDILEGDYE